MSEALVSIERTVYELSTGRILRYAEWVSTEATWEQEWPLSAGEGWVAARGNYDEHYVAGGLLLSRPAMPVTQGGNTLTVPLSTEYFVRGPATAEGVTEDGVLEFEFAEPGTYTVTLHLFPYLDAEVTLEG